LDLAVRNVNFESGKAVLTISSYEVLDKILGIMVKYPEYKLSISGYTDNVGKDATNQKLSFERAKSCMNYIVSKGGSQNKIAAKGFGKLNPVASNVNADGRSLNRRVEFKLYIE